MRTTIDIKPEHRSALLALAARRGQRGFSIVLGEAIESYLRRDADRQRQKRKLLSLAGSLTSQEAADLRESTRSLRERWR
jgi:hypothetical protein